MTSEPQPAEASGVKAEASGVKAEARGVKAEARGVKTEAKRVKAEARDVVVKEEGKFCWDSQSMMPDVIATRAKVQGYFIPVLPYVDIVKVKEILVLKVLFFISLAFTVIHTHTQSTQPSLFNIRFVPGYCDSVSGVSAWPQDFLLQDLDPGVQETVPQLSVHRQQPQVCNPPVHQ